MTHYLNTEQMRVVEKNDRGVVKYRKRYKFGDEVDTSHMDEDRVKHLTERGSLVTSKDDLTRRRGPVAPYPGSGVAGAASAPSGDHADLDPDAPATQEEALEQADGDTDALVAPEDAGDQTGEGGAVAEGGEGDDTEMVDKYSSMDYKELQDASKEADLQYVGISADQMRDNLRNKS